MFGLGVTEIVIILVVLGILFLGSKKMTDIASQAGRLSGEFKKSKIEMEKELRRVKEEFKSAEAEIGDTISKNEIEKTTN